MGFVLGILFGFGIDNGGICYMNFNLLNLISLIGNDNSKRRMR